MSAPTKTEARQKLDALKAEYAKAGQIPSANLTVEKVLSELLDNPPDNWRSPITMQVNRRHANRIAREIGKTRVTMLKPIAVERMLRNMVADGHSASTVSATLGILIEALRLAQRDHGLSRNSARIARLPGGGTRRVSRAMKLPEIEKLLASDLTVRWRAWITTALMTGLRPGELLGLTWANINFGENVIEVRASMKSGALAGLKTEQSKRTLRMLAAVVSALAALAAEQVPERMAAAEVMTAADWCSPMRSAGRCTVSRSAWGWPGA